MTMPYATAPVGFGGGLGAIVGAQIGAGDLNAGQTAVTNTTGAAATDVNSVAGGATAGVNNIAGGFTGTTQPYNTFGQSFLPGASNAVSGVQNAAGGTQSYNTFMSGYTNTPAAQYQLQQADQEQNNSAAARGDLLSGANERGLSTINSGIVSQNANTAYNEYLQGNQQGFGQLETALGNMFSAIGIGQTATGQQAGIDASQIGATSSIAGSNIGAMSNIAGSNINATSNIAQAQAKNSQSKGSGLGSLFNGLGMFGTPNPTSGNTAAGASGF